MDEEQGDGPKPPHRGRRQFLGMAGGAALGVAASTLHFHREMGLDGPVGRGSEARGSTYSGPHGDIGINEVIWSVPVATNSMALTFDDGPDPEFTPAILATLARFDVKATFNVMGWNAQHHPDLLRSVLAAGHEVTNHTWSHLDLGQCSPEETEHEILHGRAVIEKITGTRVRFFRPPRGELTGQAVEVATRDHQQILLWSLDGGAVAPATPETVRHRIVTRSQPGSIVLLHDGIGQGTFHRGGRTAKREALHHHIEIAALPAAIEGLLARQMRLLTVSGLLAEPRLTASAR